MKTGFRAEDGEIYYFSPENGKMLYFGRLSTAKDIISDITEK